MPNHVHLVVGTAAAPLDRFMQCLQQSYTQRFNRQYAQVGHLFQGRYKALRCETDEYLITLVRYVHQNPVRAGLATRAEDYPYSGHRAYLGGGGHRPARRSDRRAGSGRRHEWLRPADRQRSGEHRARDGGRSPCAPAAHARRSAPRWRFWPAGSASTSRCSTEQAAAARPVGRAPWPPTSWSAAWAIALTDVAAGLGRSLATASSAVRKVGEQLPGDPVAARQVESLVESLAESLAAERDGPTAKLGDEVGVRQADRPAESPATKVKA